MKLFPTCGEGFRRLSVVGAIVTCVLLFGWWFRDYSRENSHRLDICGEVYMTQSEKCYNLPNASECEDKAFTEEMQCNRGMRFKRSEIYETWGIIAVGALIGAYFAALTIRTLGWTVQGFRAKA